MKKEGRTKLKVLAPTTGKGSEDEKKQEEKKSSSPKKITGGKNYKPKGVGIGGKREGAGRKTKDEKLGKILGVSETLEQHLIEEVEVTELNVNTGARISTKKPTLRAILDMLRYQALKKSDVRAAKEYLDRTVGRAKQHIDVKTEEIVTEAEQRVPTLAEQKAANAYYETLEAFEEMDSEDEDDE